MIRIGDRVRVVHGFLKGVKGVVSAISPTSSNFEGYSSPSLYMVEFDGSVSDLKTHISHDHWMFSAEGLERID